MIRFIVYLKYVGFLFFVFIFHFATHAQAIKVTGGFIEDSVGIGQPVRYYLTARYPSHLNVIFPDSAYDYKPFEFDKKYYSSTHTTDSLSYDSAVYYLSTFEIESIQTLSLPAYVVAQKDCVAFDAQRDSIRLIQLVKNVPDSIAIDKLPLKMNTAYQHVSMLLNYPILLIIVGVVILLSIILLLIFGKKIRTHFKIKRLKKNHQKFLASYATQLDEVNKNPTPQNTELTLALWKKYLERLEAKPYTKLTTREVLLLENNTMLGNYLHSIDKAIYGHDAKVMEPLEKLRDVADTKYLKKLDEVKHGK